MRAAIYLRQSKDTAGTGLAVERQKKDCEKLAADRGWTVIATFTDNDTSASTGKRRPGYEQILALIDCRDLDVVIAWHVDRLTRRLSDLEDLITRCESAGVRVATVSGDLDLATDAGRLVGRILASVARGEIERKSARQKRASLQAAESGAPPARRAFGFTKSGDLDPVEAPALVELYGKVLAGMSLVTATAWLNQRGHRTAVTGREWERTGVRRLLLNPRNAGFRVHRGEIVKKGTWEPIVPEEIWRATVELFANQSRRAGPAMNARKWLGSGLFVCHCGAKLCVNYSRHGDRQYQCRPSGHLSRSAKPIDASVEQVIVARLRRADLADLLAPDQSTDVARLRDEATIMRLRLNQATADYSNGLLTGRQLQAVTLHVEGRLSEVERAMADAGRGSRLAPLLTAPDPGQTWLDADLSTRQSIIDAIAKVTIFPGGRGRALFDPKTVHIEWKGQA